MSNKSVANRHRQINEVKYGWCWYHMIQAASMAPLHSMDQDDQNVVQDDVFGPLT